MKKTTRLLSALLTAVVFLTAIMPTAFAKEFAPPINTDNLGIQTQYVYPKNDYSWIRKLTIKEDMLSSEGITSQIVLYPVAKYPYIVDAPSFKRQVEANVVAFTLDENQQKAAYLYLLKQLGAITIITEPTTSDQTKADWLRKKGIVITKEDEADPEKVLMISALYALMKNDFYYVLKGERLNIPKGTPLEEALVTYLIALSDQEGTLMDFLRRFLDKVEITSLDDYVFYSSLFALYTNGYVMPSEIPGILNNPEKGKKEVYRRMAIMTIRTYGIAIDGDNASSEEIQQKYLTAMLGMQYDVSLSPDALIRALKKNKIPFYILQRMAYEDANLTISDSRYSYTECFNFVLKRTQRFNLKNEFYADIHEYNVYLKHNRPTISISATPLNGSARLILNGESFKINSYNPIPLKNVEQQSLILVSKYKDKTLNQASTYKFNIHQGVAPAPDSDLTGIITTLQDILNNNTTLPDISNAPTILPDVTQINGVASELINNVLSLNEKGQLVDKNGNIISHAHYDKLPDGYKYVIGDDGVIQVMLIDDVTSEYIDEGGSILNQKELWIIIVTAVSLSLILAMLITILVLKRRDKVTEADKMKKRKLREQKKKLRKQEKQEKQETNKKQDK